MPRGGQRRGAGGKPKWINGKTKVIRVPEILAEKIIKYAQQLDRAISDSVTDKKEEAVTESKTINLSGISTYVFEKGAGVYIADLIAAGYQIKPDALAESSKAKSRLKDQQRAKLLKDDISDAINEINQME